MDENEKMQAELTVAFLGPPATFSHMACIQHFGSSVRTLPENTIQDVFKAVEGEKAEYGVAPVENSTEGPVSPTLDRFIQSEARIRAEIMTKILHDLLSLSGMAGEVQKIYSHPQALSQCREWSRENFPHVRLEESREYCKSDPDGRRGSQSCSHRQFVGCPSLWAQSGCLPD